LNHLFQKSKSGLPTEYAQIEETFNPDALKVIGDWLQSVSSSLSAPSPSPRAGRVGEGASPRGPSRKPQRR
jgi:hypothetical protein